MFSWYFFSHCSSNALQEVICRQSGDCVANKLVSPKYLFLSGLFPPIIQTDAEAAALPTMILIKNADYRPDRVLIGIFPTRKTVHSCHKNLLMCPINLQDTQRLRRLHETKNHQTMLLSSLLPCALPLLASSCILQGLRPWLSSPEPLCLASEGCRRYGQHQNTPFLPASPAYRGSCET